MKGLIEVKNNVLKKGIHYVTSDYKTRNSARPTHSGIDMVSYNGKHTTTDYIICVHDGIVTRNDITRILQTDREYMFFRFMNLFQAEKFITP